MANDISNYSEEIFENIKHINEYGQEFWYARELQEVLKYTQWRRFKETINRAKEACETSGNEDYMLTRYACYLIVMNGDLF